MGDSITRLNSESEKEMDKSCHKQQVVSDQTTFLAVKLAGLRRTALSFLNAFNYFVWNVWQSFTKYWNPSILLSNIVIIVIEACSLLKALPFRGRKFMGKLRT